MTAEFVVERRTETFTEREHGYEPCKVTRSIQSLVAVRRNIQGTIVERMVLDTEEVPEHVMISLGCFGDTGGWRSKFARWIK